MIRVRSFSDVEALVARRAAESQYLEFKQGLFEKKPKCPSSCGVAVKQAKAAMALELARDVAQFANADGGCLIFGVAEKTLDDVTAASGILSIKEDGGAAELAVRVRQLLAAWTSGLLEIEYQVLRGSAKREEVLALNISPSREPVAVYSQSTTPNEPTPMEFPVRDGAEKRSMHLPQLLRHINDPGRSQRILLLDRKRQALNDVTRDPAQAAVQVAAVHTIAPRSMQGPSLQYWGGSTKYAVLGEVRAHDFTLELRQTGDKETPLMVPHEWLETIWPGPGGELELKLRAELTNRAGRPCLVPVPW